MTSSCQVPAVTDPVPWLATVQPMVTCAGSPMVSDGAWTADAIRSGYGARVDATVSLLVLFDSPVPALLNSATWSLESVETENRIAPTPLGPSGKEKVYCLAAELPDARTPLRAGS